MATGIHPINYGTGPQGNSLANAGEKALRAHRAKGLPASAVIPNPKLGSLIGGAPDTQA